LTIQQRQQLRGSTRLRSIAHVRRQACAALTAGTRGGGATVASIWRYEQQGQNAQEIARLAGDLCDKISMSLGDLNVVAEKMNGALAAHNEAVKRLLTGRGNALSVGERIRSLGVKTKRPLPAMLVDGMAINSEAEEFDPSECAAAAE